MPSSRFTVERFHPEHTTIISFQLAFDILFEFLSYTSFVSFLNTVLIMVPGEGLQPSNKPVMSRRPRTLRITWRKERKLISNQLSYIPLFIYLDGGASGN